MKIPCADFDGEQMIGGPGHRHKSADDHVSGRYCKGGFYHISLCVAYMGYTLSPRLACAFDEEHGQSPVRPWLEKFCTFCLPFGVRYRSLNLRPNIPSAALPVSLSFINTVLARKTTFIGSAGYLLCVAID